MNGLLFVRPQELLPQLKTLHLYEICIIPALLIYAPQLLQRLRWGYLCAHPIAMCVVALAPVTLLSALWQGRTELLDGVVLEYVKIVLYYLLFICAIDSTARLRKFVLFLPMLIALIAVLSLLVHMGALHLETIQTLVERRTDAESGDTVRFTRMLGVGIFADPNDFAQVLGVGMVLCIYGVETTRGLLRKCFWVLPILVTVYDIYLSQSRGGLLAMVAGLGVLFVGRLGLKRSIIPGVIVMLCIGVFFAGRRLNFSTRDDSAQTRVQIWSDALQELRSHPLLGVGPSCFEETAGQVAHNSFLHAFAELGFPGGVLFTTAFAVAIWGIVRLSHRRIRITDAELAKLNPVLLAALVCYAVGLLSLTRNYVIPTYSALGLATVYLSLVRTEPNKPRIVWGLGLLGRSFALCVLYLLATQLFVRAAVQWG